MGTPIHIGAVGGEYMESVVLVEWRVKPGDAVQKGQTVAVVETAKAATDVEAPCDGPMGRILVEEGAEVSIETPIGMIGEDREGEAANQTPEEQKSALEPRSQEEDTSAGSFQQPLRSHRGGRLVASPVARRLAEVEAVDLSYVEGTGPGGRIKKRDVLAVLSQQHVSGHQLTESSGEFVPLSIKRGGANTGTPVLFIHGFASDASIWTSVQRRISENHPTLCLELPCHGRSPIERVADFRSFARRVIDGVDSLDLDRIHVVGHSLGGAVALALSDIRPRRVASLTLLAPVGLGADIDGSVLQGLCRARRPESLAPWLRRLVDNIEIITEAYARAAMSARTHEELRMAQSRLVELFFPDGTQAINVIAALKRMTAPVRIIWGRQDTIIPWQHALNAPGSTALHLLHNVGHLPHVEAPEVVSTLISQTVESAGSVKFNANTRG